MWAITNYEIGDMPTLCSVIPFKIGNNAHRMYKVYLQRTYRVYEVLYYEIGDMECKVYVPFPTIKTGDMPTVYVKCFTMKPGICSQNV